MNIKKCDRCGHIEETEPLRLRVDNPAAFMKEFNELIKNAVTILTRGPAPVYKLSLDEKELDLCEACQQELRDWFEHPDEDPETEEWNSYHGEKIKAPKGTFEAIYNDDEEETQHGDEDNF